MLEVAQTVMGVLVEGMQALVAVEILGPSQGMRTWTENILRVSSEAAFSTNSSTLSGSLSCLKSILMVKSSPK